VAISGAEFRLVCRTKPLSLMRSEKEEKHD
jgi:hypothetical protein